MARYCHCVLLRCLALAVAGVWRKWIGVSDVKWRATVRPSSVITQYRPACDVIARRGRGGAPVHLSTVSSVALPSCHFLYLLMLAVMSCTLQNWKDYMWQCAQCWASECPDVKNNKWRLNPVWQRMLYSCTHMATVGVKGLNPGRWNKIDECHTLRIYHDNNKSWINNNNRCSLTYCWTVVLWCCLLRQLPILSLHTMHGGCIAPSRCLHMLCLLLVDAYR